MLEALKMKMDSLEDFLRQHGMNSAPPSIQLQLQALQQQNSGGMPEAMQGDGALQQLVASLTPDGFGSARGGPLVSDSLAQQMDIARVLSNANTALRDQLLLGQLLHNSRVAPPPLASQMTLAPPPNEPNMAGFESLANAAMVVSAERYHQPQEALVESGDSGQVGTSKHDFDSMANAEKRQIQSHMDSSRMGPPRKRLKNSAARAIKCEFPLPTSTGEGEEISVGPLSSFRGAFDDLNNSKYQTEHFRRRLQRGAIKITGKSRSVKNL